MQFGPALGSISVLETGLQRHCSETLSVFPLLFALSSPGQTTRSACWRRPRLSSWASGERLTTSLRLTFLRRKSTVIFKFCKKKFQHIFQSNGVLYRNDKSIFLKKVKYSEPDLNNLHFIYTHHLHTPLRWWLVS